MIVLRRRWHRRRREFVIHEEVLYFLDLYKLNFDLDLYC